MSSSALILRILGGQKLGNKKGSIKVKLLIIPLLVVAIAITTISTVSSRMAKKSLTSQMAETGEFLLEQSVSKMENNSNSLAIINGSIEDDIRKATRSMMRMQDQLTSEKLTEIAEDLELDEINYFNNEGVLVYSNIEDNLMWEPDSDHPLYAFINGDKNEMMEEIREDPVSGNNFKYGV